LALQAGSLQPLPQPLPAPHPGSAPQPGSTASPQQVLLVQLLWQPFLLWRALNNPPRIEPLQCFLRGAAVHPESAQPFPAPQAGSAQPLPAAHPGSAPQPLPAAHPGSPPFPPRQPLPASQAGSAPQQLALVQLEDFRLQPSNSPFSPPNSECFLRHFGADVRPATAVRNRLVTLATAARTVDAPPLRSAARSTRCSVG